LSSAKHRHGRDQRTGNEVLKAMPDCRNYCASNVLVRKRTLQVERIGRFMIMSRLIFFRLRHFGCASRQHLLQPIRQLSGRPLLKQPSGSAACVE
jgi:hypothetical protein